MMSISEILQALEYFSPKFPREALEAASEQKEELSPALLSKVEGWKGQFCELPDNYYLHIYGFFLLAEFREKKAYPLIVDLMIEAGEEAYDLFGDFITENLSNVLASVYDGDLGPILHLINTAADEFVRGAGIKALVILYFNGQLSREGILTNLEKLGRQYLEAGDGADDALKYLTGSLVCECLDIHGTELNELIEELFDANLVDEMFVSREDVQRQFAEQTLEATLEESRERENYQLINSTITEMEDWFCFKSEEEQKQEEEKMVTVLAKMLEEFSPGQRGQSVGFESPGSSGTLEVAKGKANPQKKAKQKQQKLSRKKNRKKKR